LSVESVSSVPLPVLNCNAVVEMRSALIVENFAKPPPDSKKTVFEEAVTIVFPRPT
jgi:hypothetical protein